MSLRKSPTLTPALIAANRRNAQKSTGPRTARGKAWSRLNRLKDGWKSPDFRNFVDALVNAEPCQVDATAALLLHAQEVVHPRYREWAELCIETEVAICRELRMEHFIRENGKKKNSFSPVRSRKVIENKG